VLQSDLAMQSKFPSRTVPLASLDACLMYQVWNESFQFAVPAGGGSDLVTLVVWSVTDGNKRENLGHIAVPASRVASTGKEEVGSAWTSALNVPRCVEIMTRHDATLLPFLERLSFN
jgi:hypothetical protein